MGLHGTNDISDAANPAPVHTVPFSDGLPHPNLTAAARDSIHRAHPEDWVNSALPKKDGLPFVKQGIAETPEYRTRHFRGLRLTRHQSGALACNACHYVPYYCHCCAGLKCLCIVEGVYRHWVNGVPNPTAKELGLLEEVDL